MNWRSTRSLDFAPCAPVEKEDTGTFAECCLLHFERRIMNVRGGHWQWKWTLWKHLTHRGKWLDGVNIQLLDMSDLIIVSDILIGVDFILDLKLVKTCKVTSCHCDGATGSGRMADFSTPGIVALAWATLSLFCVSSLLKLFSWYEWNLWKEDYTMYI